MEKFITVPPNLNVDNENHNFFAFNGELRYMEPVPKLIKTVGKDMASKVLWGTYLLLDPDSKFFGLRFEERQRQIAKNVLGDEDFDWEIVSFMLEAYPNMAMSKKKRNYFRLETKYQQLLNEVEGDNVDVAVNFFSKLKTILGGLDVAEKAFEEENAKVRQARGSEQSGVFGRS